jgi:hypothetical protein
VEVIAFGPDAPRAFRAYFARHHIPFRGVPDPSGRTLAALGQVARLWALGRLPGLLAVRDGGVVWRHEGRSPRDLPDLDEALQHLTARPGDGAPTSRGTEAE